MKYICSLVVVEDIQKSRHLYETVFGQKVKSDFGENVCFHGDFAIHDKAHFGKLISNSHIVKKANNFELYFEEDNMEPLTEKLKELGLEFIHGIIEQPWRQRVMRFYDYDKNIIEIGESLEHTAYRLSVEGKTIDEIVRITYLSEDAVMKAIEEKSR